MTNTNRNDMITLLVERAKASIEASIRSLTEARKFLDESEPALVEAWNVTEVAGERINVALGNIEGAIERQGPVAGPPGGGPVDRLMERALNSRAGSTD